MKKFSLLAFLTFAAAFTPIAAKYTVNEINPLELAFLRFGVATLLLYIVCLFKKVKFSIEKEDRLRFLFLGFLVIPFNQFVFLTGIKMSGASHSGILYACTPLIVYLVSIKLKQEVFDKKKLLFISMTIIGIFVIFYENIIHVQKDGGSILKGDILLFMAVTSFAVYLAYSKSMIVKYGSLKTQTIAFIIGSVIYLPVFIYNLPELNFDRLEFWGILGYFHLTFIVAFSSYFLYNYSTKFIPTSTLTTLTNTSPVFTILLSWILLKESLSYFFILGAIITIFGVLLTQINSKKRPVIPESPL
ncbi:DMT family transporter [soil metagenome]